MYNNLAVNGQFTQREIEILELVAKATLRKNIAYQLNMSIHTVDSHLRSIHQKTNTNSMAELILYIMNSMPNK